MTQVGLLGVVCNRTRPAPATADADFIAIDDASTQRYLCKGQSKGHYLPASEWICSHLARDCGLPVPPFSIVQLTGAPDVSYFGSQWQGGALDPIGAWNRVSNPGIFSLALGADLFVHNVDRHLGNYLYLDLAGEVVARLIDFSRAWLQNGWPLPDLPLPAACHTLTQVPIWRSVYPYSRPGALLDKIAALPIEWMMQTLHDMPDAWLSKEDRLMLRSWWIGKARETRVNLARSLLP